MTAPLPITPPAPAAPQPAAAYVVDGLCAHLVRLQAIDFYPEAPRLSQPETP